MQNPRGAPGKLIGTVEAAKYLEVHRSTVNLAVKHDELLPDAFTPRGHYRFSHATLDAYRVQLSTRATASRTIETGARVSLRALLLARLMRMSASDVDIKRIAQEAIAGIMDQRRDLTMGYVCVREEDRSDPYAVRLLAEQGIQHNVTDQFKHLSARQGFAVVSVMASGQIECCNDTTGTSIRPGSRLLMAQMQGLSFLVLPLKGRERVLGLMGFMSARKFAFSEEDTHYYSIIADLLASRLHDERHRERLAKLLGAAGSLAETGLSSYTTESVETLGKRLRELAGAFRDATGAYAVCSDGLLEDIRGDDAYVEDLAHTARAAPPPAEDTELPARIWESGDHQITGVRVTIPLLGHQQAGLAAAWSEPQTEWPNSRAALWVLGAVCALVQARARLLRTSEDGEF